MAAPRLYQLAFSGGEISPGMFGRIDDAHYRSGAKTLRNFVPIAQGPVLRRPGTELVRATKDSLTKKARLIPFVYSIDQTYVLEVGAGYFRFHVDGQTLAVSPPPSLWASLTNYAVGDLRDNGGTYYYCKVAHTSAGLFATDLAGGKWHTLTGSIYEIPNSYVESNLPNLTYAQSADVMTFCHTDFAPAELRRLGANLWTFASITFGSTLAAPTGLSVTVTRGDTKSIKAPSGGAPAAVVSYNPIELTTPVPHNLVVGASVYIENLTGVTYCSRAAGADISTASPCVITTRDGTPADEPHGFQTGTKIQFASTVGGIAANTDYYVVRIAGTSVANCSQFNVATSLDNARAGILVNNTGASGTSTIKFPDDYYIVGAISAGSFPLSFTLLRVFDGQPVKCNGAYDTTNNPGRVQEVTLSVDSTNTYVVTAVDDLDGETIASSPVTATNNLFVSGAANTLRWTAVSGAKRYRVFKLQSGVYGYIGQSETASFTDDSIAPDLGITPPLTDSTLTNPGAVAYYQQRRAFAGPTAKPNKLWLTRANLESDLSYHIPVQDSDRVLIGVSARYTEQIKHIVPLGHLMLLTTTGEYRVTPLNSDAITPTSVAARPQSFIGSSYVTPLIVNGTLLFAAARGGHVRELGFDVNVEGSTTGDLSIRAGHLFDGYTILDAAQQKAPYPVCWFVSSSGKLLGFTYVPEEKVGAWSSHDTRGGSDVFESVAVVPEAGEDRLYAIVLRANGRYIERMRKFAYGTLPWFVDSGIDLGAKTAGTVTGLSHLANQTVHVIGDGAYLGSQVVTAGGAITLSKTTTTSLIVGIPMRSELETLPSIMQLDGYGAGRMKNVDKAWIRTADTSVTLRIGPSSATADLVNVTPSNDIAEEVAIPTWSNDGRFVVRVEDPFPATIVSLTLQTTVG